MDLSDKQNETIISLTKIIKEQRYEIEQLKCVEEADYFSRGPDLSQAEHLIAEHEKL